MIKKGSFLNTVSAIAVFALAGFTLTGCSGADQQASTKDDLQANVTQRRDLNIQTLERIIGMKASVNGGEAKFTVPQNDLNVTVDGFKIIPPMM